MWEVTKCWEVAHLMFTCLKSTIKTLEKDVKYVQSKQKKHHTDVTEVVLLFFC